MRERQYAVNSGLLVCTTPDRLETVLENINTLGTAEVSSIVDDSRIVIIVHAGSMEEKMTLVNKIEKIDGVLSVNLTYDHIAEDETEGKQEKENGEVRR